MFPCFSKHPASSKKPSLYWKAKPKTIHGLQPPSNSSVTLLASYHLTTLPMIIRSTASPKAPKSINSLAFWVTMSSNFSHKVKNNKEKEKGFGSCSFKA